MQAREAELAQQLLTQLKPPRGRAPPTAQELLALEKESRASLGPGHWVSAGANMVMHLRTRPPSGQLDNFTVACGVRFLGFILSRELPLPSAAIVRTPISIACDCCAWMTGRGFGRGQTTRAAQEQDLRCVASRILSNFLLPVFNASGKPIARIAGLQDRVDALCEWRCEFQSNCGCCGRGLGMGKPGEDGLPKPLACGRCKQLRYCSKECQQKDWSKHKLGCIEAKEPLTSDRVMQLLSVVSNAA